MKREDIVKEARKYVERKARWQKMGRTAEHMDCYGLVILVRAAFGLKSEDWQRYSTYPSELDFISPAQRMFTQVSFPPYKDGQLLIFQQQGRPIHVGITATDQYGRPSVIHCAANRKVCFEEAIEGPLQHAVRGVFDFPGVED
jgi:cell wall-associated NlpC family hydrolase